MSKIEVGRFSDLLRRALGMKGQQVVSAELSPEMSPTWMLESNTPEWMYLKGVKIVGASEAITNNAAGGGQMQLRNPPGSGVLAEVNPFMVNANGLAVFTARLQIDPTPLLNSALTVARDTRWDTVAAGQQSALLATFVNNTVIGIGAGTFWNGELVSNRHWVVGVPVVLAPGFALNFGSRTANTAVELSVYWQERAITPLEL